MLLWSQRWLLAQSRFFGSRIADIQSTAWGLCSKAAGGFPKQAALGSKEFRGKLISGQMSVKALVLSFLISTMVACKPQWLLHRRWDDASDFCLFYNSPFNMSLRKQIPHPSAGHSENSRLLRELGQNILRENFLFLISPTPLTYPVSPTLLTFGFFRVQVDILPPIPTAFIRLSKAQPPTHSSYF